MRETFADSTRQHRLRKGSRGLILDDWKPDAAHAVAERSNIEFLQVRLQSVALEEGTPKRLQAALRARRSELRSTFPVDGKF